MRWLVLIAGWLLLTASYASAQQAAGISYQMPDPGGGVILNTLTVANLPPCTPTNVGNTVFVVDAPNGVAFNAVLTTGGGSAAVLAMCNGTNWTAH